MNNFDFIIIGAGCSGLSLLYEMNKSNILKNKTCAIFDKRKQFSKDLKSKKETLDSRFAFGEIDNELYNRFIGAVTSELIEIWEGHK
jgi:flavin-dependent dehydrogenase